MEKIDSAKFNELLKGEKKIVCDFFATWCGPCKMLAPVMERVAAKNTGKALFVKVDIDENPDLAQRYGIMSIPCVMVFDKGEAIGKTLGYMNEEEFDDFLLENL